MGSSEAHTRRQRIARLRQKHPAMVDQLSKDFKERNRRQAGANGRADAANDGSSGY